MTNNEILNAYVGDTQVEKIYLGADVVYSANTIPLYPFILDSDNNTYSGTPLSTQGVYVFEYQIPYGASWTLYFNGQVVTASSVILELHIDCNGDWYNTGEGIDDTNYPMRDIELGYDKASDEDYVGVGVTLNTNTMSIDDAAVTVYSCEPEPTCADQGECGDYPDCHPCEDPCNGDPECECNEQGGTWDGENCN